MENIYQNQLLILDILELSKLAVNKVTQFILRPPKLQDFFTKLGDYYRWFIIMDKVKVKNVENILKMNWPNHPGLMNFKEK